MINSTESQYLEASIRYHFSDPEVLRQALTHRSFAQESPKPVGHNERLEFLGDAVLGFLVSEALAARYPDYSEGQLSKLKAYLVSAESLQHVARELDLGRYLRLGKGEEQSGGRQKKTLLVNGLEALTAALYLDGGLAPAKRFVDHFVLSPDIVQAADNNLEIDNYKSALQEFLQARKLPTPSYGVIRESGPPHRRTFTIELCIGESFSIRTEGLSKKTAEQEAARLALENFRLPARQQDAPAPKSAETGPGRRS